MAIPTVNIVGPGGQEATVNESSLAAWERNGWSLAPEKTAKKTAMPKQGPTTAAKKTTKAPVKRAPARDDSA